MVWSTCTIIKDKVLSKVKDVHVDNTGENFVQLRYVVKVEVVVKPEVVVIDHQLLFCFCFCVNDCVSRWRLDCSDRGRVVVGYQIEYCPLKTEHDGTTFGDLACKTLDVSAVDGEQTKISDLSPWTPYKVHN